MRCGWPSEKKKQQGTTRLCIHNAQVGGLDTVSYIVRAPWAELLESRLMTKTRLKAVRIFNVFFMVKLL